MAAVVYLIAKQSMSVTTDRVLLKEIAEVYCQDKTIENKLKVMPVIHFHETGAARQVINILKIIEEIEKVCPEVSVESIGENDVIVDYRKQQSFYRLRQTLKIIFVSCICFSGTALTIMAFHNDIGINKVFGRIYQLFMGEVSDGCTILEVSYSIGLAVGIIVFFNHIGGYRLTKDPTPIEVEMRIYEKDVNTAIIETAQRKEQIHEPD